MAEADNTSAIIAAIEKGYERTEGAVSDLSIEIRALSTAIAKGFSNRPGGSSTQPLILLAAMAAILFGLMTPVHSRLDAQGESVSLIDSKMDADTERERGYVKEMAEMRVSLKEVATRFDSIGDLMDLEHGVLAAAVRDSREAVQTLIRESTRLKEQVKALERLAYPNTPQ